LSSNQFMKAGTARRRPSRRPGVGGRPAARGSVAGCQPAIQPIANRRYAWRAWLFENLPPGKRDDCATP
jgi:hypothetical protein